MEENKFFKIKQCKQANGDIIFKVYGYGTRFENFFNMGDEYSKDNKSFEEALDQIEHLSAIRITDKRTIFKTRVLNSKGKKAHRIKKYK